MARDKIVIKGARVHNLKNINVEIPKDKMTVVTGLSGSGKSSLGMALLKLQEGVKLSGSILFNRQELVGMSEEEIRSVRGSKIAIIFQEPMSSLNPLHKVGKQILEVLALHTHQATKQRVYELLRLVELNCLNVPTSACILSFALVSLLPRYAKRILTS